VVGIADVNFQGSRIKYEMRQVYSEKDASQGRDIGVNAVRAIEDKVRS
jgi:hypothetical protein